MENLNKILVDREQRVINVNQFQKKYACVIVIKSNLMGSNKTNFYSHYLVNTFYHIVKNKLKIEEVKKIYSFDGPYFLLGINNENELNIKNLLISIEEEEELGRLIDLDLFSEKVSSISRLMLGFQPRKCLICNQDARVCSRNQTHSLETLLNKVHNMVEQHFFSLCDQFITDSMLKEINLDPKFGLVTPTSQGSHPDMDYFLMVSAQDAIRPYFLEMVKIGFYNEDLDKIFAEGRKIGIKAENAMNQATKGINAYKGLIFIFGFALLSFGYTIKKCQKFYDIFENVRYMGRNILNDFSQNLDTNGEKYYKKYGILGARGEVFSGFPAIRNYFKKKFEMNDLEDLIYLIQNIEDTVLLKRSGSIEEMKNIMEKFKGLNSQYFDCIMYLNNEMIAKNMSFGGSADLLVVLFFLKFVKKFLFI